MRRTELIESVVIFCDWCGEKITDYAHTTLKENESEKDFHSWDKKCIDEYEKDKRRKKKKN